MKPKIDELTATITDILKKYPPAFFSPEDVYKNTVKAFQELVSKYPEIVTSGNFNKIYTPGMSPEQIAKFILEKPKAKRSAERGKGSDYKLLQGADRIIYETADFIKERRCTISVEEYKALLRASNSLRNKQKSIDDYVEKMGYGKNIKRLIGKGLSTLYEVEIIFRTAWYSPEYIQSGIIVRQILNIGKYSEQINKHLDILGIDPGRKKGKKRTPESICKAASQYQKYLRGEEYDRTKHDGIFYYHNKFCYLSLLILKISQFFESDLGKEELALLADIRDRSSYQDGIIDLEIDKVISKPRDIHGVAILPAPMVKLKASMSSSDADSPKE